MNMENVRKHRDIKLFTTEKKGIIQYQNQIIILQVFHRKSISNRNEKKKQKTKKQTNKHKKQILMNKPVQLRLSISEFSKILIYEFWHDYVKPKYGDFDMDI